MHGQQNVKIFIAVSQLESYTATAIINDMSDHDGQLLKISTDYSHVPIHKLKIIREINKFMISDFIDKLSCESWDSMFNSEIINAMFNSFLDIYFRIFNSSFPLKTVISRNKNDDNWITSGIRTSCRYKRELHSIYIEIVIIWN